MTTAIVIYVLVAVVLLHIIGVMHAVDYKQNCKLVASHF